MKNWIWLFFLPLIAIGQDKTTTVSLVKSLQTMSNDTTKVNQLQKITLQYINSDSTKAILYGKKALQLAQKLEWNEGIAISNFQLGSVYSAHYKYDKALLHFNKALATNNQKLIAKTALNMGCVYTNKSDYPKALDYFHKALKIDEAVGNKKEIAKIAVNMGSVYYGLQKYTKALTYFNQAAKLNTVLGNETDLTVVYRNIAGVYNSLDQYSKALSFYERANDLCIKLKNKPLQARILSDIALVYFNMEDYDKAIENSHLSLKAINKKSDDKQTISFNHGVLGDSYIEKAKSNNNNRIFLDSANINLIKAVTLHEQLKSRRDLVYDFTSITQVHKLSGDYKKALQSYETAVIYKDSILNSDTKETIKNLEDKRTIELKNREIKINNLQLEVKEKQKWILISGLILLGIIGGLLVYQNKNRKKVNQKLQTLNTDLEKKNDELDQANKIKARFFSILNHDLRSPVYNLIHFLHLKKENPELLDEELKNSIEKKTIASAENLASSMEDMLLWSKSQMENFKPQPEKFSISSLFEDTENHFSSDESIKISFENSQNLHLNTDENYLKTIIRNLTGNAIKALAGTENSSIVWRAWHENNQNFLSISDNGVGGKPEQFKALYDDTEVVGIKTGLGLHLIRDLAKAINCEIIVETKINQGTIITLKLK